METFNGVSEVENRCLMRCAGVIRKEGWEEDAVGMVVYLDGPAFYYHERYNGLCGYYTREYLEEFMQWQEEEFR